MTVLRIVPHIKADQTSDGDVFYCEVLGLETVMDMGFVKTHAAASQAAPQLSVTAEGGSGQDVPHLSVEVDDFDAVLARAAAHGITPTYGPVDEPWGVRRAYLPDPFGNIINVLTHTPD
jgi:catechol 2,3-dioxygenase-like lactoylglutathione lyase family enzyme